MYSQMLHIPGAGGHQRLLRNVVLICRPFITSACIPIVAGLTVLTRALPYLFFPCRVEPEVDTVARLSGAEQHNDTQMAFGQ